jgi:hypothetical protein
LPFEYPSQTGNPVHWLPAPLALRSLARLLGGIHVSASSFYRWVRDGRIPSRKVGARLYVAAEDLSRFAELTLEP